MLAEPLHISKDEILYFMEPEIFRELCPSLHVDKVRHGVRLILGKGHID